MSITYYLRYIKKIEKEEYASLYEYGCAALLLSLNCIENRWHHRLRFLQCAAACRLYLRPHLFGSERHIDRFDARQGQRVQHSVYDGRWRADAAAFAYPLRAQWIERGRRLHKIGQERGNLL